MSTRNALPDHCQLTRREALVAAAGTAIAGCSRKPELGPASLVSITRAADYSQDVYEIVRRILTEHKLDVRGKRVVLKPNLVEFDPGTAINTHPVVVHAALEAFHSLGAADVRIAEGPGHRRVTLDLAEAAGYFGHVKNFEDVFTDLNLDEVTRIQIRKPFSKLTSIYLPNTVLACDLLVSMPKLKTHHWVGATLSMKNLFGVVPGAVYGWPKNILHWSGINECIADLHRLVPNHFCIVDGIEGMEGNGPIQGQRKHAGVLIAGRDMIAVDATACRIMQLDPGQIHYLNLAADRGQTNSSSVRQIGELIETVSTPFAVIPEFQHLSLVGAARS